MKEDQDTNGSQMGLPLVGSGPKATHQEFTILYTTAPVVRPGQQGKTQTQNLPMKEDQDTNGSQTGLPLVGIENSQSDRKERRRTLPNPTRFHDHLALESKPHFMIIFRLENAVWLFGVHRDASWRGHSCLPRRDE
jgi:hypothetical protein